MRQSPVTVRYQSVPLVGLPAGLAGLRIAHVSDLHFRRPNRTTDTAASILRSLSYDLLAVTGDFAPAPGRWAQTARYAREYFEPIARRAPIYAVLGNHDDPRLVCTPGMPLVFLRNRSVSIAFGGVTLRLAGVEQSYTGGENLSSALSSETLRRPTILLAHYPSTVFRLPDGQVDLILSGHTHAGQIRLPLLGCAWPHDRIPRRLAHGLHRVNGTYLHVTSGIGASPPLPLRLNCPPEICVLTLQTAGQDPGSTEPPGVSQESYVQV